MKDMEPLALAMTTQELFSRKFRSDFGDNLILRNRDSYLEPKLLKIKREMNSLSTEKIYLEGHKMILINNIDKLIHLVTKYSRINSNSVDSIIYSAKDMIKKIISSQSFDDISRMEGMFKSQILFPIYDLFKEDSKNG